MMKNSVARALGIIGSVVVGLTALGCGDDRNYPEGFLAEAAKEGPAEGSSAAAEGSNAQPSGGSQAGSVAALGARRSNTAGAPARETPIASIPEEAPIEVVLEAEQLPTAETLAAELKLPPPPEVKVIDGEEPYKKLAQSRKFDDFRRMSARYIQLRAELLPYGVKLASGTATPAERAAHNRIEDIADREFKRLNAYMWDSQYSEEDRAAMGWIIYGAQQQPQI